MVIRHYTHIGFCACFSECDNCCVVLQQNLSSLECNDCDAAFNNHLTDSPFDKPRPYSAADHTILTTIYEIQK